MPWHQSKSDPRKVYNELHQAVGVMQTAAQAMLIVEAVNKLGPERYREKEGGAARAIPDAGAAYVQASGSRPRPAHTWIDDECCGDGLFRLINSGKADEVSVWTCPKCGCDWSKSSVGPLNHWSPVVIAEVIR